MVYLRKLLPIPLTLVLDEGSQFTTCGFFSTFSTFSFYFLSITCVDKGIFLRTLFRRKLNELSSLEGQRNKHLGIVIQMNQLDATMIYWSISSAQHVSGNILPIIRNVRLRFLQHMYPVVVVGRETVSGSSPSPCPPQQQDTICCKNRSLTLLMMGKLLPETCWAELIDQ